MITQTELKQRLQAIGPWHSCTYEFMDNIQKYTDTNIDLSNVTINLLIDRYLQVRQPNTIDVDNSRNLLWNILRCALHEIENPADSRTEAISTYLN
jgi:hypothetical protein